MSYVADMAAGVIREHGATITLKREGETDLPLKGKRLPGEPIDIGGSAVQQGFRVKIAPVELLASAWQSKAPRRGDTLVVDGRERQVLDVQPRLDGDTVALYELTVAG